MQRRALSLGASFPVENPAVEHLGRDVVSGAESPEGEAFGTDEAFREVGVGSRLGEENPRGVTLDGLDDGSLGAGLFGMTASQSTFCGGLDYLFFCNK